MNLMGFSGMAHPNVSGHGHGNIPMQHSRNPFAIQEILGLGGFGTLAANEAGQHSSVNGLGHSSGGVCSIRPGSAAYYPSVSHANGHQLPVNVQSCLQPSAADVAAAATAHHAAAATARMYFSSSSAAHLMNSYMPNVTSGPSFQPSHSQHVSSFLTGFQECSPSRDTQSGNFQCFSTVFCWTNLKWIWHIDTHGSTLRWKVIPL